MSTRDWYLRARSWTYYMSYGPGLPPLPSTSKPTSGSGFVRSCWRRLSTWWNRDEMNVQMLLRWLTNLLSRSQRFNMVVRRYRHIGTHRGFGRNTRTRRRRMRLQTSVAMENKRQFAELMTSPTDPTLIGEAWMENPIDVPRVYRRLSTPRLRLEANTQTLIRPKVKEWDPYDEVP